MKNSSLSATALITRQNIMDAFWELYKKNRIEQISVSGICKLAGYNRSTFYAYFTDIYDVLDELEKQILTPERFKEMILSNMILSGDKKAVVTGLLAFYEENSKYFSVLLGEQGDPGFRRKLLERLSPVVYAALSPSADENKQKLGYIMEYQSSAVLSMITRWYANEKDIPAEEFIELLIGITTNGIQKEIFRLTPSLSTPPVPN